MALGAVARLPGALARARPLPRHAKPAQAGLAASTVNPVVSTKSRKVAVGMVIYVSVRPPPFYGFSDKEQCLQHQRRKLPSIRGPGHHGRSR
jgi:hypothetical protein